jgi:hypothetical protein
LDEELRRLFDSLASPAEIDAILSDLELPDQDQEAYCDADCDLLSLMVDEALRGVDIPERYPAFWQKMLANAELHEAFVDCLEVLAASRGGWLRPWPEDDAGLST